MASATRLVALTSSTTEVLPYAACPAEATDDLSSSGLPLPVRPRPKQEYPDWLTEQQSFGWVSAALPRWRDVAAVLATLHGFLWVGVTCRGGGANTLVVARMLGERSDGDLLGAVVAGDSEAFAVFYRRYVPRVVGLLIRQTHDREVAADLAAEVFAAVLLSAQRFRGSGSDSAWPWVCGIAQNKLRESRRRGQVEDRARRRLCLEPEVLDDAALERIEELGAATGVLALLEDLPERQREAVRARVLQERDYADIAAELRCSEMVVRQQVSRGLTKLRLQLQEAKA